MGSTKDGGEQRGGRTRSAALTAATNLLVQIATMATAFVVTPILVDGLGRELYGAWRMILQLTGFLVLADLGGSTAVKWTLAQALSSDDVEAKRRQVGASIIIWTRISMLILAVGAGLVVASPYIIRVEEASSTIIALTVGLMIVNLTLSTLVTLPAAILRGMNLEFRAMGLNALTAITPGGLGAIAVILGLGLPGVALGQIGGAFVIGSTRWWVAKRALPWLGLSKPKPEETKQIFGLSVWLLVWKLVWRLDFASDVIIVGMVLSATAASSYSLTAFLMLAALAPMTAVVGAALPGIGDLVGQKAWSRVEAIRRMSLCFAWLMATAAGATAIVVNPHFLRIWTGAESYAGDAVNIGLTIITMVTLIVRQNSNIINTTLDISRKVIAGGIAAVIAVTAGTLLTFEIGPLGIVIGLGVGRVFLAIYYAAYLRKIFGKPLRSNLRGAFQPVIGSSAVIALAIYIAPKITLSSWPALILGSIACAGAAALLFALIGLPPTERRGLVTRFRSLLSRTRKP